MLFFIIKFMCLLPAAGYVYVFPSYGIVSSSILCPILEVVTLDLLLMRMRWR